MKIKETIHWFYNRKIGWQPDEFNANLGHCKKGVFCIFNANFFQQFGNINQYSILRERIYSNYQIIKLGKSSRYLTK